MAVTLDDAEFWLPPQFLSDDEDHHLPMDLNTNINSKNCKTNGFGSDTDASKAFFPFEFPYAGYEAFGAPSDLSSPVESVVGSSETESDEEDYLAGLTRQMARSTLQDGFKHSDSAFGSNNSKTWVASGSPQSTLCAVGSGCGCGGQGSSRGSPNAQSPPTTWDLLHAAAGEVAKMRIKEEALRCGGGDGAFNQSSNRGLLGPPRKQPSAVCTVPLSNPNYNPDVGFYLQQPSLSHKNLQAAQFQRLRQQQMMKEQSSVVWGRYQQQTQNHPMVQQNRARNNRPLDLSPSAWPPLQQAQQQFQQTGSGLRAVFLGNSGGAKKECAGTGVFLPRQIRTQSESRKKPGCSTVLLPARVVQALNLNLDDMGALPQPQPQLQRRFNGRYNPDYDVAVRLRANNALSQQKRNNMRPQPPVANHEIRLPQEWTY